MKHWGVQSQTLLCAIAGLASALPAAAQEDDRAAERAGMVQEQLINRRSSSPQRSSGPRRRAFSAMPQVVRCRW